MYNLPYFKNNDEAAVTAFMKEHPFITLMGVDEMQKPVATQVPVLFVEKEGRLYLRGHIMKNTDHHKAFSANPNVMALFTGPHTYVSASWYTNTQQGSTWNYMNVQAKGEMVFLPEEDLLGVLHDLTTNFEQENSPASYSNIPEEYISRMIKAIVAFDIKVTSIEHVFKLSQNRDQQSFENILVKLNEGDAEAKAVAAEMNKIKDQLFPAQ